MPIVRVSLIAGRSPAVKRDLIARVTDAVVQATGVQPQSVRVLIDEVAAEHWAVGGVPKSEMEDR